MEKTKKCKYCMSEIHEKASVCPQCRKSQYWWNSWLMFVIYIAIVEMIVCLLLSMLIKF